MKKNRIIAAVLAAVLALSGCACENSKDKKNGLSFMKIDS